MSEDLTDERLDQLRQSYDWLANDVYADKPIRSKDREALSIIKELQHCRTRYCPECRGLGWVRNPNARYEMDYVDGHLATGVYSTIDPEEIDCPSCNGVGFITPTRPEPPRLQQVERDDGDPF